MTKSPSKFLKVEATGNDFVLIENEPVVLPSATWIATVCAPHTGVGADGVIYLWQKNGAWHWRFFNNDGSETDLCGNAARCVGRYLQAVEPKLPSWQWSGSLGRFEARPDTDGRIAVTWPSQQVARRDVPDDILQWTSGFNDHGLASLQLWQVGVPHLVLVNHEAWNLEQRLHVNSVLRAYPSLGPEGANVTWLSLKTSETVTFERGVEKETLACGSGAVAAFLSLQQFSRDNGHPSVPTMASLKFPGGTLEVRDEIGASAAERRFWLVGPARLVYRGEFVA